MASHPRLARTADSRPRQSRSGAAGVVIAGGTPTPTPTPSSPVNSVLPAITGTAQEGQVLSVSNGSWSNSPTSYSYQWRRGGVAISGSINATRTLTSADVGAAITCTVTATNADGSASATSAATATVIAATVPLPVNTVAPAVSGTAAVGQVLTSTTGTWSNSPTSYVYQWRRDGVDISGATASTYTLVSADAARSISCRVLATNAGGTTGATSNAVTIGAVTGPVEVAMLSASRGRYNGNYLNNGSYIRSFSNTEGMLAWAEALDPRIKYTTFTEPTIVGGAAQNGMQFGTDGDTMTQMLQRVPAIIASDAKIVLFDSSVGNVGNDTPSVYASKAQFIINLLRAGGKSVVWLELWDRGAPGALAGSTWNGGSGHTEATTIRSLMNAWCSANDVPVFPMYAANIDPATSEPFTYMVQSDRTHPSPIGGKRNGKRLATFLANLITSVPARDPTVAGNYVVNPTFAGTGGSVGSGFEAGSVVPTNTSIARGGTGTTAKVTTSVTGGKLVGVVDRSTMPSTGLAENVTLTIEHTTMANALWWQTWARLEHTAADGIRAIYTTLRDNTGSENYSRAMTGSSDTNSPTAGVDSLYQDTDATDIVPPSRPISFANAAGVTFEIVIAFDKGAGGSFTFRFSAPEVRQVADPHVVRFDETNVAAAAISTNATQTIAENSVLALQLAANHPGTWSVTSGADQSSFSVDNFGVVRFTGIQNAPPGSFDFEDSQHAPSYVVGITLTPTNTAIAPVSKTFTINVTDVADGFSDLLTTNYAANAELTSSGNWTAGSDYVVGSIVATGGQNGVKTTTASGGSVMAPQQGDTVEQAIAFTPRISSTSNGSVNILQTPAGASQNISVAGWSTTITLRKNNATLATFNVAPYKTVSTTDLIEAQIRQVSTGVYKVEAFLNGVNLEEKFGIASGTTDVSADVTGAGALAGARRSGLATRGSALSVSWVRGWNNRLAYVRTSLDFLKALTWAGGSTTYVPTSGTDAKDIAGRTGTSAISLGTITPTPASGSFLADGSTVRANGLPSGSGPYTVQINETQTDGTVAAPTTRSSSLVWGPVP